MKKFYLYFYNNNKEVYKVLQARNEEHATDCLNLFRRLGNNVELKIR